MPVSPKCVLVTKPGYRTAMVSRGLLMIQLACDRVVRDRLVAGCPKKLTLTAGSNGRHSANGPHYVPRCEALDVRSKDFIDKAGRSAAEHKRHFLVEVAVALDNGSILRVWDDDCKVVTRDYFLWLEKEGQRSEHFHIQVRKGHTIR